MRNRLGMGNQLVCGKGLTRRKLGNPFASRIYIWESSLLTATFFFLVRSFSFALLLNLMKSLKWVSEVDLEGEGGLGTDFGVTFARSLCS
jgi:hypothetical protein